MKLDIGIKNKIKAALIEGTENHGSSKSDKKFSPEVIVNA